MKIAIIGSGAAALGVLDRFSIVVPRPEITLIDRAEHVPANPPFDNWTAERLRLVYRQIRAEHGNVFPPPKTNFGKVPKMQNVEGWGRVWDSNFYGGLTSIWGLCSVPFSPDELRHWPFGRTELDPHYAAMAKRIGIAGEHDALNQWFGQDFVNRPAIMTTPTIRALEERINSSVPGGAFRFISGISRLALETRLEETNSCVACGECMSGCPREAMHSTILDIDACRRDGLIARTVGGRALAVEGKPHHIIVETAGNRREAIGPFDLVYVCAGCFGTTEFAMRSLGLRDGPQIVDNSLYSFPLLYTGRAVSRPSEQHRYLGLTNLLVNAIPQNHTMHPAQIQVYLFFDHLWRYFIPYPLWPLMEPVSRALRCRMLIARLYLHGEYSQRYSVHVEGHRPAKISLAHTGTPLDRIPDLWGEIREVFNRAGFLIPLKPMRQRTSSHYAASLPLGRGPVELNASIKPGVYLCDSSVFPTAPATSPTFTIMANARRIAHSSLSR